MNLTEKEMDDWDAALMRIPTSWQTVSSGIQRRRTKTGNIVYRVRLWNRIYPVLSVEEGRDLIDYIIKHRPNIELKR